MQAVAFAALFCCGCVGFGEPPGLQQTGPLFLMKSIAVTFEKETGLDFFSLVPRQEQDRLESTITLDAWSW